MAPLPNSTSGELTRAPTTFSSQKSYPIPVCHVSEQPTQLVEPPYDPPIDRAERIKELRGLLKDDSFSKQHRNLATVISLYESDQIRPRDRIFVQDGHVVTLQSLALDGPDYWIEVYIHHAIIRFYHE